MPKFIEKMFGKKAKDKNKDEFPELTELVNEAKNQKESSRQLFLIASQEAAKYERQCRELRLEIAELKETIKEKDQQIGILKRYLKMADTKARELEKQVDEIAKKLLVTTRAKDDLINYYDKKEGKK